VSLVTLERLLWKLKVDQALAQRFVVARGDALASFDLSVEERAALENADLAELWRFGVHPLLLAPFGRLCGIPPDDYRRILRPLAGVRDIRS
jgi:Aromatic-ring-opening dioxygenase LigAB, LigA subunit